MEHLADSSHATCLNCDTVLHGEYCSSCGQAAHEGHAPTLGHFAHDLLHEFLHVDGKIFRTLKALLLKPGLLTEEYWRGRITFWFRPIRIFLIVVALNLLIVHEGVGPMNFRIGMYQNASGDTTVRVDPDPDSRKIPKGLTPVPVEQREEFSRAFRSAYSAARYVSVLLFAGFSWLIFRRRQKYLVNHLIAGLHYYSFWYLLAALGGRFPFLQVPVGCAVAVYLFLMIRRLYGLSWWGVAWRGTLMLVFLMFSEGFLGLFVAGIIKAGIHVPGLGH